MKFWWWLPPKSGNFGDILTPVILDYFGIKYEYDEHNFQALCVGSIAKRARPGTIVLGSGIIGLKDSCCPEADWRFVRGPITRNQVISSGGTCPEIYGDPGLLLPMIFDESKKIYDIDIVPHFTQYEAVKARYYKHKVINLRTDDVAQTVNELTQCRSLISSSLHGIVVAHAYKIPVARVEFAPAIKGDGTKFLDHYQALNIDPAISHVKNPKFTTGSIDMSPVVDIFRQLKDQIQ